MNVRYKFIDNEGVYFTTSTIAGWTDACLIGTGRFLHEKFVKQSFRYCQQSQDLKNTCVPTGMDHSVGGIYDESFTDHL